MSNISNKPVPAAVVAVSGVPSGALAAAVQAGVPRDVLLPCLPPFAGIKTFLNGEVRLTGHGKAPALPGSNGEWFGLKDWQRGGVPKEVLLAADKAGSNAGMLMGAACGDRQYIGIDIDLNDVTNAATYRNGFIKKFSELWRRPLLVRKTVPFRALLLAALSAKAFPGTKKTFHLQGRQDKAGPEINLGKIEILTAGQQCIIGGTHTSGRPIEWYWTDKPDDILTGPRLTDAVPQFLDFDSLIASITKLLDAIPCEIFSYSVSTRAASNGETPELAKLAAPSVDTLVALIDAMPNPASVDRDTYTAVMYAISGARAGLVAVKNAISLIDEERIAIAAASWAARWQAPHGHTAGLFEDELAKWQADWVKPQSQNYAGWVQLLRHAHAFGTGNAVLAPLAMEQAQDAFQAEPLPAGMPVVPVDPVTALIKEFNNRYMVVLNGGRAVVYQTERDPRLERLRYTSLAFDDLKRLYMNRKVPVGTDANGRAVLKSAAEIWLEHPTRRQFIGGMIFDPSGREQPPDVLNLWQGLAVTPRPGSWARLQEHLLQNICCGNRSHYDYLIGWMARLVQHPGEQGEVAVVLKGIEGCGKGTLGNVIRRLFGQHAMKVSNAKHLVGNFNAHLRDTVFLFADEAFFAGDKAHIGILNSLITEDSLTIEPKRIDAFETPNYIHLMMASNEKWVVPASLQSRRFFVLEVSSAHAQDTDSFGAIWQEMDNGGYEALLHDLLNYDLANFNIRRVPVTDALIEQRKRSLPTTQAWWLDCLHRGFVYQSRYGLDAYFGQWHLVVATELLFASYSDYAKRVGERHPISREELGRFMREMSGKRTRPGKMVIGETTSGDPIGHFGFNAEKKEPEKTERSSLANLMGGNTVVDDELGQIVDGAADPMPVARERQRAQLNYVDRVSAYSFGDLITTRQAFEHATKLTVDWDKVD